MRGFLILLVCFAPLAVTLADAPKVAPITKELADTMKYNPREYWVQGTDVVKEFSIEDAKEFYNKLFELLGSKFVRNVSPSLMLAKAVEGLGNYAGSISVDTTGGRLLIYDKNYKLLGNFPSLELDDAQAWANMMVNIVISLRDKNKDAMAAHPEQIYHLTAQYLLSYLDEGAVYLDPYSAMKASASSNTPFLGFTWRRVKGGIQVLDLLYGGAAYFSDIREGDVITAINGRAVSALRDEDVEAALVGAGEALVALRFVDYATLHEHETTVRRMPMFGISAIVDDGRLVIHNFNKGTAVRVKEILDGLKADNLVIDVRGAQGGEFMEAVETANLFVDGKDMLKVMRADGSGQNYSAKSGAVWKKPLLVLADNTTKGVGEDFTLALRGRAVVLGTPTLGDGMYRETFDLNGGRMAKFATGEVVAFDGTKLQGIGVVPVVCLTSFVDDKDLEFLVSDVKNGKFKDNRTNDVAAMRKACPATYSTFAREAMALKVAAAILGDDAVYGKLLSYD